MPVKIVKVRVGPKRLHPNVVYIGRSFGGWSASPFYSPFQINKDGTRAEVIEKFAAYWYAPEQAELRAKALQVIWSDDTLGCWCKPLDCHGDIIAGYVNWKKGPTLWL
jgi:hypothetical protein